MKRYYSVTGSLLAFCWLFPVWALREFCVISQPKAGTNITAEVLQRATGKKRLPSVEPGGSGYFPSSEQFIQIINRGGYFPGAHAFYTDELYEAIAGAGIAIIFVQRDPRDVVVSFARWRKRENRFGNIDMASVSLGQLMSDFILSPYKWLVPPSRKKWYEVLSKVATNLKAFYEAYFGWRQREGVFVLRYEDLLGGPESSIGKRAETLRELFDFIELTIDNEKIKAIAESIDSMKVATFTPGKKIGRWKDFFTEKHIREFNSIAGDLLGEFGYA